MEKIQANRRMESCSPPDVANQKKGDGKACQQDQKAPPESSQQIVPGGRVVFCQVGVDHHGRHHQIEQKVGKGAFVPGMDTPRPGAYDPCKHQQKEDEHLLERNNSQIHACFTPLDNNLHKGGILFGNPGPPAYFQLSHTSGQ